LTRIARFAVGLAALSLLGPGASGCAYFNTLYNAKQKYREALDLKARAEVDRPKITSQEEKLYTEAFEKAARVVKYYPDSRWVDDALLLMARASHEKGDYSTALRKYDEILQFYPKSDLVPATLVMEGRTAIEVRDFDRAVKALRQAQTFDKKELRGDVSYFLGVVEQEQGNPDDALALYTDVLEHHGGSEWYAQAGMHAGRIAEERGDYEAAVDYYERVRSHGHTPKERYDGGMAKGEALLALKEWKRARITFHDVASRTVNEQDRSHAYLMEGNAVATSGKPDEAARLYRKLIEDFPRTEAAGEAQFAIAKRYDDEGDLEKAHEEYDLVKEQGTGHPAWLRASQRQTEIQRVLDLRKEIAEDDDEEEKDRKRFLLAEQLLEKIGDVDGALEEYASLANDADGTEWGFRALFAEAWVLENRLDEPDSADALLFKLANKDTRTDVGAAARRRHHMPVWKFEEIVPPKVVFIREGGEEAPADVVMSRVEPRDVPLPPGVNEVKVWARITVDRDGSAKSVKVVKSGGDAFDEAAEEAAKASRFLPPEEGGPEITVVEYRFPPRREEEAPAPGAPGPAAGTPATPATPGVSPPPDDEPSADERDLMLDRLDAAAADSATAVSPPPATGATIDSSAVPVDPRATLPIHRDRGGSGSTGDD